MSGSCMACAAHGSATRARRQRFISTVRANWLVDRPKSDFHHPALWLTLLREPESRRAGTRRRPAAGVSTIAMRRGSRPMARQTRASACVTGSLARLARGQAQGAGIVAVRWAPPPATSAARGMHAPSAAQRGGERGEGGRVARRRRAAACSGRPSTSRTLLRRTRQLHPFSPPCHRRPMPRCDCPVTAQRRPFPRLQDRMGGWRLAFPYHSGSDWSTPARTHSDTPTNR